MYDIIHRLLDALQMVQNKGLADSGFDRLTPLLVVIVADLSNYRLSGVDFTA